MEEEDYVLRRAMVRQKGLEVVKPVEFKDQNDLLKSPEDMVDCDDLPICRCFDYTGRDLTVSCWELTEEDIKELIRTRKLFLWAWGRTHPPISVSAMAPSGLPEEEHPEQQKCTYCGAAIDGKGEYFADSESHRKPSSPPGTYDMYEQSKITAEKQGFPMSPSVTEELRRRKGKETPQPKGEQDG